MYDLAPRFPEHHQEDDGTTGPDSFLLSNQTYSKDNEHSFPFNATSPRFRERKSSSGPSPADYYPKYRKHRILNGKSLQYTSCRVCIVPKKKSPQLYSTYTSTKTFCTNEQVTGSRNIRNIIFGRKHTTYSKLNDITEDNLRKYREALLSRPLPNYLQFPGEVSKASVKYRGSRWSQYKAKRDDIAFPSEGPGPGAYYIKSTICPIRKQKLKITPPIIREKPTVKQEFVFPTCNPSFDSTQPGHIPENLPKNTKVFDGTCETITEVKKPSEGTFFDGTCDYLFKKISHNKNPKGIWGSSKRFVYKENDLPAPSQYYPVEYKCKRRIIKRVPFLSCEPRFKVTKNTDIGSAPVNVEVNTTVERSCKKVSKVCIQAPFGSTTPIASDSNIHRKKPKEQKKKEEVHFQDCLSILDLLPPFPQSIYPTETESERKSHSSKETPRIICDFQEYYETTGTSLIIREGQLILEPEPDLRDAFNNIKSKKSHRRPIKNEGFLSTQEGRTNWLIQKTPSQHVNWPELKEFEKTPCGVKMVEPSLKKESKRKEGTEEFYNIHPMYGSAVYKGTFNCRLKGEDCPIKVPDNPSKVKTILKCYMPKELLNV